MNRGYVPLHGACCDDKISFAHKLNVDAVPPFLVDVLPVLLFMRCLYRMWTQVQSLTLIVKTRTWPEQSFGNEMRQID